MDDHSQVASRRTEVWFGWAVLMAAAFMSAVRRQCILIAQGALASSTVTERLAVGARLADARPCSSPQADGSTLKLVTATTRDEVRFWTPRPSFNFNNLAAEVRAYAGKRGQTGRVRLPPARLSFAVDAVIGGSIHLIRTGRVGSFRQPDGAVHPKKGTTLYIPSTPPSRAITPSNCNGNFWRSGNSEPVSPQHRGS